MARAAAAPAVGARATTKGAADHGDDHGHQMDPAPQQGPGVDGPRVGVRWRRFEVAVAADMDSEGIGLHQRRPRPVRPGPTAGPRGVLGLGLAVLMLELRPVELGVEAVGGQQLGVPSLLHDAAVGHHQDHVGFPHRRQPVGDDQGGPPGQGDLEGLLDGLLRFGVEMGGGLVEDDDVGRLEQQPGDGDALLLPARQPVAAVTDQGVEPVGQRLHQGQDLGRPQDLGRAPRRWRRAWRRPGWSGSSRGRDGRPG